MSYQETEDASKDSWEDESPPASKLSKLSLNPAAVEFRPNANAKPFVPSWLKTSETPEATTSASAPPSVPSPTAAVSPATCEFYLKKNFFFVVLIVNILTRIMHVDNQPRC
jgi:hypothetical protein